MLDLYVDGDACPVKEEAVRVASRHGLKVLVVAHRPLRLAPSDNVEIVVVRQDADAADDWIASRAGPDDIVVTSDILLARRCLERGARVLGPDGRVFTEDSIGDAVAQRDLMDHLRLMGERTGGPPPFRAADRSRFLSRLHETIEDVRRQRRVTDRAT